MSSAKIISATTAAFADLWYESRDTKGVTAPHKNDLPLRALARFMPNIALVSFDENERAKYELFGTQLAEMAGVDLTGHYLDETFDEEAKAQRELGIIEFQKTADADALRARWSVGSAATTGGRVVQVEDIALPYFDGSSHEMRHMNFATVLGTLDFGEGVSGFFAAEELIWFDASDTRPAWLHQKV